MRPTQQEIEDVKEYMSKNFAVKISPDKYFEDFYLSMSITHNGNQWTSISIYSDAERKAIIKALREAKFPKRPKSRP